MRVFWGRGRARGLSSVTRCPLGGHLGVGTSPTRLIPIQSEVAEPPQARGSWLGLEGASSPKASVDLDRSRELEGI